MAVFPDEKSYTSVSTCQIREDTGSVRTPQWCSAVAGLSSIRRTVSMKSVPFRLMEVIQRKYSWSVALKEVAGVEAGKESLSSVRV
jgi:hypothetical protein